MVVVLIYQQSSCEHATHLTYNILIKFKSRQKSRVSTDALNRGFQYSKKQQVLQVLQ